MAQSLQGTIHKIHSQTNNVGSGCIAKSRLGQKMLCYLLIPTWYVICSYCIKVVSGSEVYTIFHLQLFSVVMFFCLTSHKSCQTRERKLFFRSANWKKLLIIICENRTINYNTSLTTVYHNTILEGEQKKSRQTVLSLEAISYTTVLQSAKLSCLLLDFL